jgi:hypothetical protein
MGPVQQFVGEQPHPPLTLHIYPGEGVSWLYEDDGESLDWQRGMFRLTRFEMHREGERLHIRRHLEGDWMPPARQTSIHFHGCTIHQVFLDGAPHSVLNNQMQLAEDSWHSLEAVIA